MEPKSHFLRLPAELRNIIYSYLLVSPPIKTVECANALCNDGSAKIFCTTEDNFLASTCRPQENSIRTFKEAYNHYQRGADIHTSILRVNKLCYRECAAILYGNTQIVMRQSPGPSIPSVALPHVSRLHLALGLDSTEAIALKTSYAAFMVQTQLPSVRVVSLHIDIDLVNGESITPTDFRPLLDMDTERVSLVIDLHVTRAWEFDGFWSEAITMKKGHEEAAQAAQNEAFRMRALLTGCLAQWAREAGKRFRALDG